MADERKGFIIYGDIEESVREMTDQEAAELFRGMLSYFNTGEDPGFTGALKFAFIPIRQQMDRDRDKYEKRCERNRENIRKRWAEKEINKNTTVYDGIRTYTNDTNTNTDTKTNKDKDKDNDTNTNINIKADKSAGVAPAPISSSSIRYLNEKTGGKYKTTVSVTRQIKAILEAGHSAEDIRAVIDKKTAEWGNDPKMRPYLRPSTLFGEKFEEYLAAPEAGQAAADREEAERKERARKAKEEQKRREEELDRKWKEEHKDQLEHTHRNIEAIKKKYGIGVDI